MSYISEPDGDEIQKQLSRRFSSDPTLSAMFEVRYNTFLWLACPQQNLTSSWFQVHSCFIVPYRTNNYYSLQVTLKLKWIFFSWCNYN